MERNLYMLKLPKCPYCGCGYDYSRVKKHKKDKFFLCASCGKKMAVLYKKNAFIMAVLFFFALIVLNVIFITFTKNSTIYPNLIFTVTAIVVYLCLIPFTVKYHKIKGQEDEPKKLKKNRHRHEKTKNNNSEHDEEPLKGTVFENL